MRYGSIQLRGTLLLTLLLLCTSATATAADGSASAYLTLPADRTVSGLTVLLSTSITLSTSEYVYVQSDGRYGPSAGNAANVYIAIDGQRSSNDSLIDWRQSTDPQQHSFNAIGAAFFSRGTHTVQLIGEDIAGSFYVGAGTNLGILANPATSVSVHILAADVGPFAFTTGGLSQGTPAPHTPILSDSVVAAGTDVIALASGRVYEAASQGDAMWGISLDGSNAGNDKSLWTVNDICTCAETQAPLYTHAFFPALSGRHSVSLDASEFPWQGSEDTVSYNVGAGTRLILLSGGMSVRGSAPLSSLHDAWWDWVGMGTSSGWPGVPPVGTNAVLTEATFTVPVGHNGVVMFVAKSRVQGDTSDPGGTVSLWITVDGQGGSSTGVQQIASPDSDSQRTITASYLAAGAQALTPGVHTVRVYGRVDGRFVHLAMVKDLPLIWFD